jgi:type VI secretion system secreted protein Hcp
MQVSRTYDKASPLLFNEAVVGKPQKAVIHFLEPADGPDASPNVYLEYQLRNCLISSYSVGGGGGGASESLSLNFTAINIQYTTYDEADAPTPTKGAFDLVTAKQTWWS